MKRKSKSDLLNEIKSKLRKEKLGARNTLSKSEMRKKSASIVEKLYHLPEWEKAHTILSYVSIGSEVETERLIKTALRLKKKVVIPKIKGTGTMLACTINDFKKDLSRGCFGILEPKHTQRRIADRKAIDIVIVPGVCFDEEKGARIGFGGGYYDRFLHSLKGKALLLGLSFECQLVKSIPCLTHDVNMDIIITEKRVLRFD